MPDFVPSYATPASNRQVILSQRPSGIPRAADFTQRTTPRPSPADGQFLIRNLYLSADPVQRGWAATPALTPLDTPMRALAVGVVLQSRLADIEAGSIVYGFFGWQDYTIATEADLLSHIATPRVPISAYAGVLGMPGVTAWLALHDLAPPSSSDTLLVSTAAGAVGSVVGQIARKAGARVVGLTGSDDKVARCTARFGYDAAYNYKTVDLPRTLAAVQPAGFTIYFDNTGGTILDAAVRAMARHGRIIQCGTAATATWTPPPAGLRNEREVLTRVLTWSGFYIFDHVSRFAGAIEHLTELMLGGALNHDEDITDGIDQAPSSLENLYSGANTGKKLIYIG